MTRIKIRDIYKFILKVLPITPEGDLLVDVESGKKIILSSSKKEGIVEKTAGILDYKSSGIQYENKLRKKAAKRLSNSI